jgi:hypothetical protein
MQVVPKLFATMDTNIVIIIIVIIHVLRVFRQHFFLRRKNVGL